MLPLFPRTTLRVHLDSDIKTNVDIAILAPPYTLATPVWGGRLDYKLFIPVRGARTQISDTLRSFGDPAPQLSLKWNEGVNNLWSTVEAAFLWATTAPSKGHGALDNGFGYTHISMKLPVLNSLAVSALTYNFLNPHTDYQNGIDWHTDCAQVVPDQD